MVRLTDMLPTAVLCGDLNMLRCFAGAGVPTLIVSSDARDVTFLSRHCGRTGVVASRWQSPERSLDDFVALRRRLATRPVLFYGDDATLLLISRNREVFARDYHFLMPPADLVETLVDKSRFAAYAEQLQLTVPRTMADEDIGRTGGALERLPLPCVIKPRHHIGWRPSLGQVGAKKPFKALRIERRAELERQMAEAAAVASGFILQEWIPGGEEQVYSYHAYVAEDGRLLGRYVGRKIRTYPMSAGVSTYLELIDDPEILRSGRDILERMGLVGPVKLDFKRHESTGKPYLLEVNPRFNLWNYLGAACGVNLPLVAYRERIGQPVEPELRYRTGVRWLSFGNDARAFLCDYGPAGELSLATWLRSLRGPKVYDVFAWDDPLPFFAELSRTLPRMLEKMPRKLMARVSQRACA